MAKVKRELVKVHLEPTPETQKAIYDLLVEDYKKQFEELKQNKGQYEYSEYRKKYIRLIRIVTFYKNKANKVAE